MNTWSAHSTCLALLLIAIILTGASVVADAATLKVGSVADLRFGTGWTLDGSELQNTRAKLLNPANFGPAGRVARSISITDTAATAGSVTVALLSTFDIFFIGYLDDGNANAFTGAELTAFQTWVNAGGTLIVTCDDASHDAVCASFGYPALTSATNPMTPVGAGIGHPIFAGPFGSVPSFTMGGTMGFFTTTVGATVLAQDSAAHPVFLVKEIGAGRVILFSDVNIIGGGGGTSSGADITTSNDRLLANLFTFAATTAPLRVGSVADSRFNTSWTLDGVAMVFTRAKLLNPSNFGAGGTFPRPISITDTAATLTAPLLDNFDVFFIGYLDDASGAHFTAAELTALQSFVNGGGTLIVTCDDAGHDAVCASFGYPAANEATNPMTPVGAGVGHPIFAGPFGSVPTFNMDQTQGFFTTTAGASILAQDSAAHPVFLFKALGAGRVILFSDVDIIAAAASLSPTITTNNDKVIGNLFAFAGSPTAIFAAVLPFSRSIQVAATATAFGTIISSGGGTAIACGISPITALPATFHYQRTDPLTNALVGAQDTAVTILGGALQPFVFSITPTVALPTTIVQLSFKCANTVAAPIVTGLNTLLLTVSTGPVPDIIALAATVTGDGIVHVPGPPGSAAFAVATSNVGAAGSITMSAGTTNLALPITLTVCQTDPGTGVCISAIGPSVTTTIGAGATPTFAIFVTASGSVPFDPANNRIFVVFIDGDGIIRGATSVAVRTP